MNTAVRFGAEAFVLAFVCPRVAGRMATDFKNCRNKANPSLGLGLSPLDETDGQPTPAGLAYRRSERDRQIMGETLPRETIALDETGRGAPGDRSRIAWLTGRRTGVSCRRKLAAGAQNLDLSFLTSPDFEPAFWTPERLDCPSAWWGHVPFALWLVASTEPRLLVELGTHHGVSYAAFCEAVSRRRLSTRCYAVDAWTGDSHSGAYEEDVYTNLKSFHDEHYGSFSQLLRTSFDEACGMFVDGTIDLLHIDGYHTYESVRHDFDAWRPKLSDRAVVLFHDTNERRADFGVWRFLAELKEEVPTFEFLHTHGLGVAAVGARAPEVAKRLCGLMNEAEITAVRERFSLLGARWEAVRERAEIGEYASQLQAHAHALEAALQQKEAEAHAYRETQPHREARLRELEAAIAQMTTQEEASQSERRRLATELDERNQALNQKLSDLERVDALRQHVERQLAEARLRPARTSIDLFKYRVLQVLSSSSLPLPGRMTARFAKSAQKHDPRRSLRQTGLVPGAREVAARVANARGASTETGAVIDERPTLLK